MQTVSLVREVSTCSSAFKGKLTASVTVSPKPQRRGITATTDIIKAKQRPHPLYKKLFYKHGSVGAVACGPYRLFVEDAQVENTWGWRVDDVPLFSWDAATAAVAALPLSLLSAHSASVSMTSICHPLDRSVSLQDSGTWHAATQSAQRVGNVTKTLVRFEPF